MTTINTIEDLLKLLDENPQWVEALRARLLTRELIDLPEKFAKFVEETNRRFEELNQRMDRFDQRMDKFDQRMDGFESDLKSLRDSVGILRGAHARNVVVEDAATIAREMGLLRTKTLNREDLWDITDSADTTGIPPNELRSFRRADLIMEATDQDQKPCYIAVEISFTANGRDTTRAIRNAGFLKRFTGKPAYAAIAGLYRDDRIQGIIESEEVFWYQLGPEHLESE